MLCSHQGLFVVTICDHVHDYVHIFGDLLNRYIKQEPKHVQPSGGVTSRHYDMQLAMNIFNRYLELTVTTIYVRHMCTHSFSVYSKPKGMCVPAIKHSDISSVANFVCACNQTQ